MAIGQKRRTTEDLPEQQIVEAEEPVVEEVATQTSEFVRILHNQVGRYSRGSVIPAVAFEFLDNLIKLGALEYDYEATEQRLTGNAEHIALLGNLQQAMQQTIPIAPWANALPANILGAKYVPLNRSNRTWTSDFKPADYHEVTQEPVITTQVENATKEVE